MKRSSYRKLLLTLSVFWILLGADSLVAQQDPTSSALQIGIARPTTALTVEQGIIDVSRGALHLEIALGTPLSVRGKMEASAKLVFDSHDGPSSPVGKTFWRLVIDFSSFL